MPASAILVLSSDAGNRDRLRDWLSPLGCECHLLSDEASLWNLLREHRLDPPGLLVFDAHPAEDSYSLVNRLQGEPAGAELPVLLLTDNLSDASRRFYAELMFGFDCLPKPVDPDALRDKARACLALHETREALVASMAGADWAQTLREGLLALDAEGRVRYASRQAARWLRLSPLTLQGMSLQSLLDVPVREVAAAWQTHGLARAMGGERALEVPRLTLWRGDGGSLAVHAALVSMQVPGIAQAFAFRPLSDAEAGAPTLAEIARVDLLTGLPTRPHLEEALAPLLSVARPVALLLIDIDHLRHINETLGYDFGDQLLRAAAARLRAVREAGMLVSLGSGKFALMVESVADYRVAGRLAQRLQAQFRLPFLLAGHEVFCTISIGIALSPAAGDDPEQVLRAAERALERAKALGRGVIQFDAAELNRFSIERLERETAFHQALREERLSFAWRVWHDAEGRSLAIQPRATWPDRPRESSDLQQLAEECGHGREFNDWLFRQAVHAPAPPEGVTLAFAVTAPQLLDPFGVARLRAWLHRHSLPPSRVLLFVPWREDEACVLRRRVPELVSEGVRLALYLNGQGSGLDALTAGPWQALVLGREFVQRLPGDEIGKMLPALVALARTLECEVYCESLPPEMLPAAVFSMGVRACGVNFDQLPSNLTDISR
ncbi:MAG TPA: diguanylate cyclase [Moraxellaceae bacterium]|nr:diguanylate cyclase [Moraxellaceae bacterium]